VVDGWITKAMPQFPVPGRQIPDIFLDFAETWLNAVSLSEQVHPCFTSFARASAVLSVDPVFFAQVREVWPSLLHFFFWRLHRSGDTHPRNLPRLEVRYVFSDPSLL
jgi:hypothetical protein